MLKQPSIARKQERAALVSQFRLKVLCLVLLVITPIVGLLLKSHFEQRKAQKERIRENALAMSKLAAERQEGFVRNARQLLATLTEFPFLILATNASFAQRHLNNLLKLSPDYLNFGIVELDGTLFCSGAANTNVSVANFEVFRRVKQTEAFAIGGFELDPVLGQPCLTFGCPVFDERSRLQRVLFSSLKLSLLSETSTQMPLPDSAVVTMFDRRGSVLARKPNPEDWVGGSIAGTSLFKWALAGGSNVSELPGVDQMSRLYAVTPIHEAQVPATFVAVGLPTAALFAAANRQLIRNCIVLAAIAICLMGAAYVYAEE